MTEIKQRPPGLPGEGQGEIPRLEQGVFDELLARIEGGTYAKGARLPTEHALSGEFGVSRPVVRNALSRLRASGLIVSRRGAGSFVADDSPAGPPGYTHLRSIQDIAAYWQFRALVESEAAALAADRRSDADVEQMMAIHQALGEAMAKGASTVDLNRELHMKIASMAGNPFFGDTLRLLTPQMDFVGKFMRSLNRETYQRGKERMHEEHAAFCDAIARRDPQAAAAAMRRHLETSQRRVFTGE